MAKVGGYVLGNLAVSVIAGVLTLVWLLVFGVPNAALLAIAVPVLDLIPVVGSVIGGVLISVVAVLVGGALLGIIGALVAIPIAAAILLLVKEVLYPRLDQA